MKTINKSDLKTMNEQEHRDFVLVNVLGPDAFKENHIRTSINIPVESPNFVSQLASVAGGKDREVVVYCANAECNASPKAAEILEENGFSHVFDYEGGMQDWMAKAG